MSSPKGLATRRTLIILSTFVSSIFLTKIRSMIHDAQSLAFTNAVEHLLYGLIVVKGGSD